MHLRRREALGRLAWFGCMPVAAGLFISPAAQAAPVVPAGDTPYLLRRTLVRGLSDGKAVEVVREWTCMFERVGAGQRITGEQTSVTVDAPEILEPIARLERERATDTMFPIMLDRNGRIVDRRDRPPSFDMGEAVRETMRIYREAGADEQVIADAKKFIAMLHKKAAEQVGRMPRDLFYPKPGNDRQTREVTLPGEVPGRIEIAVITRTEEKTGLLTHLTREVVTHAQSSIRRSSETWELEPA